MEAELNETKNVRQDVSFQALSLARAIDRLLPDQNYVIRLKKSSVKAEPWEVTISIENTIRVWKINERKKDNLE